MVTAKEVPLVAALGTLRVAMVHGAADPTRDGVADYLTRLVRALAAVEVEVSPVAVTPRAPVPGTRWEAIGWWPAAWRAARAVRRLRPDLVHVQFAPSAYRFSGAAGLLPLLIAPTTPLVTTLHEYGRRAEPGSLSGQVRRGLERVCGWDCDSGRLIRDSDTVVVTNAGHAEEVSRRCGASAPAYPPMLVPIPPNVEDHGGRASAGTGFRRRLGLSPATRLVAFFGFVHPVKGVRYLLESLRDLRARHPAVHLAVIGGFTSQALPQAQADAFRGELTALARRQGVADAVSFTGYLPAAQVSEALHACDVAVLPFCEGVTTKSGALLTTLAHHLPTAVTAPDQPDPEIIDGETVALIAVRRDPASITRTLDRLLGDEALRRRLARGGRQLAARRRWEHVATAHRTLYESLLAGRHG